MNSGIKLQPIKKSLRLIITNFKMNPLILRNKIIKTSYLYKVGNAVSLQTHIRIVKIV